MDAEEAYRVLLTGLPLADEAMATLRKRVSYCVTPPYPEPDQIAALAAEYGIQGMIVRLGQITRQVLAASPHLRVVVSHGVGVDHIDVEAATELGIPVCITASANFQSVAEHALAMMLCLAKNLFLHDRQMRRGVWDPSSRGTDLFGKCLGIVGVGRIGRRLAELVQPFGTTVIGYSPRLPADRFPNTVRRVESLDELLRQSDFVSLHCPRTQETYHLIGQRELETMKPTAVLISTARGGIVDESALIRALEEGAIWGAGLDNFETEPLPSDSPLLTLRDRLICTPHIAGMTKEALVRMGTEAVGILLDFLDGKEPALDAVVNPGALPGRL